MKKFLWLSVLFSILLFSGCSNGAVTSAPADTTSLEVQASVKKPVVAVSIVPEQAFVEAVAGDMVETVVMVPSGYNPENYEPTVQEVEKFHDASIYFSIGVPTEETNILPNVGDVKVVSLQDEVAAVYPERTFESGERDPHIWLSPKRAKVIVQVIADQLSEIDPENKAVYSQNAEAYIKQLDEVDQEITTILQGVNCKKFIVFHPAFGYFADDYGLEMYALEEEGKEATAQRIQEMIDLAKQENIKVIFYQEEIDSSQSEAFAEEIGGKTMQLSPLSKDYLANLKAMAKLMAEVMQ